MEAIPESAPPITTKIRTKSISVTGGSSKRRYTEDELQEKSKKLMVCILKLLFYIMTFN